MCGIAGFFDVSPFDDMRVVGERMLNTIRHRGPDASGIWVNENVNLLLGHRRLAIQDLSVLGAQPMLSHSRRYCVVFNGEIYNFKEIATNLVKKGVIFRGRADTEVLLAAIEHWGLVAALQRFTGMFAFSLWDEKEKKLHLCRDRLGEKPLYYGRLGSRFYFSSELKAIECATPRSELSVDSTALNAFLRYGYIDAPYSIYQNIKKLLPGTVLTLSLADVVDRKIPEPVSYWNVLEVANEGLRNTYSLESEAIEDLDVLLRRTIRCQLTADVKVGTFLSGGVDSTLVSAIAQQESDLKIKTFTIGFHEKEYDESPYAKKIAQHIGSDHQEIYVSSRDALDLIPKLSSIYDEPFADSSQIPTYLVSKIAKQQVTVCLSGDGGDELFAGYNRYLWLGVVWSKIKMLPLPLRKLIGEILSIPSPALWEKLYAVVSESTVKIEDHKLLGLKIQKLAGLLKQRDIHSGYDYLVSYWGQPNQILTPEFRREYSSCPAKFPLRNNAIEEFMYWDQMSYLSGDSLTKVDRASMSVSLETRLPLLSHEVIEFSWRLPLSMKVRGRRGKLPLRKVLERYVPSSLIERPKMGFSVPVSNWLQNDLKEWAEDMLFGRTTHHSGYFDNTFLRKIWGEHLLGKNDHSHRLWTVLMFLSWYAENVDKLVDT